MVTSHDDMVHLCSLQCASLLHTPFTLPKIPRSDGNRDVNLSSLCIPTVVTFSWCLTVESIQNEEPAQARVQKDAVVTMAMLDHTHTAVTSAPRSLPTR
ncbi:hypothetical protein AALO_G00231890 [Alosa alosa]|uniref:Uncharacterized protein n=1 Tax=Alosa alosa TaxID=278164 RepID=A0AAV6FZ87_9TELE|nr:hypothetical protein AALO_G00231890 [Alosa alosa]